MTSENPLPLAEMPLTKEDRNKKLKLQKNLLLKLTSGSQVRASECEFLRRRVELVSFFSAEDVRYTAEKVSQQSWQRHVGLWSDSKRVHYIWQTYSICTNYIIFYNISNFANSSNEMTWLRFLFNWATNCSEFLGKSHLNTQPRPTSVAVRITESLVCFSLVWITGRSESLFLV